MSSNLPVSFAIVIAVLFALQGQAAAQHAVPPKDSSAPVPSESHASKTALHFAATMQLGWVNSGCDLSIDPILTLGGLVRAHVLQFDTATSLYMRAGANIGAMPSFDAGLGVAWPNRWFTGISIASLAFPTCSKYDFFIFEFERPLASLLVNIGYGVRGFYFELNLYPYLQKIEWNQYREFAPPGVDPYTRKETRPFAFAVRLGYIY